MTRSEVIISKQYVREPQGERAFYLSPDSLVQGHKPPTCAQRNSHELKGPRVSQVRLGGSCSPRGGPVSTRQLTFARSEPNEPLTYTIHPTLKHLRVIQCDNETVSGISRPTRCVICDCPGVRKAQPASAVTRMPAHNSTPLTAYR